MTPRHTRPRDQSGASSQPQPAAIQPSDYESDVYDVPPPTTRSNTELNLSVLRRHCASISTILSIAPSAQIYTYVGGGWNKTDIEGTLFLCQTGGGGGDGGGVGYVVVVLNRRGLENLVIDLGMIENVEVTEEFLMVG
ncbi:mRNA-decapping enzyme subunit, partial [Lachnellula hyalina]